ncbi:L,D-transpeptidase family protein [Rhodoplanes sp. SY1]|uniref:L,D-transpeptidase family protein n=1 Tax=Rhodoplanes sp. SY1 TaxID=3166646 RepID=UPI0038B4BD00
MIRVTGVRARVLAVAIAAACAAGTAPVHALAQDGRPSRAADDARRPDQQRPPETDKKPLPAKATKELPPALLALLREKRMPKQSPIVLRVFKEEAELEVWKQDASGRFQHLKTYPICRWSGDLGPKHVEGDRQSPEGFYTVTPALMNPHSAFHLSINTGYPNAFDRANGRTGSLLMIHGDCASAGCYAMTDGQIEEIWGLARDALAGRPWFQVQAYPFRLSPANLARHRDSPNLPFWTMLKIGHDHFETSRREPKVDVCERRYVFDAKPLPNASTPFVFDPVGKCPPYGVDPKIAGPAQEKQRADAAETARLVAQLVAEGVPAAPIYTGLDGGMHDSFRARFFRVVIPLAKVMPYASHLPTLPPIPWVDNDGSLATKWFGTAF